MSDLEPGAPAAAPPPDAPDDQELGGIGGTGIGMAELGEYLDADCLPPNPVIDESPECQAALDGLRRMRALSLDLVDDEASRLAMPADWIARVLDGLETDLRAGRDLPLSDSDPGIEITISEGAVRELVRAAGDAVPGIIVGRVQLDGDASEGEPVGVTVRISAALVRPLAEMADSVRDAVNTALLTHTELDVTGIDVIVDDVHPIVTGVESGTERGSDSGSEEES